MSAERGNTATADSPTRLSGEDPYESIGGIRRVCIEELMKPNGDRSVCTLGEVEKWDSGQRKLVEGVDVVDDKQDATARDTLGIDQEQPGTLDLDGAVSSLERGYGELVRAVGPEAAAVTVAVVGGITLTLLVSLIVAMLSGGRSKGGYHSHGGNPIQNIRGANW